MKIKKNKFFHLSKPLQRNYLLFILLASAVFINQNVDIFIHDKIDYQYLQTISIISNEQSKKIDRKQRAQSNGNTSVVRKETSNINNTKKKAQKSEPTLFYFDPNRISKEKMHQLGIDARTANTLIKYRNAGGRFTTPSDLKKVYGISDELFLTLKDYIEVKKVAVKLDTLITNKGPKQSKSRNYSKSDIVKIELNAANAEELQQLSGIGPAYSNRIIKYRDLLGGYYRVDQLKDVYGFPDSTYQKLKNHFTIDEKKIRKMDVFSTSKDSLAGHFSISWKDAKVIKNYVYHHITMTDIRELHNIKSIDSTSMSKMIPYLKIQSNAISQE